MIIETVAGVIVTGGRSRRMGGGDKTLLSVGGQPLLRHIIGRIRPQVGALAINANGDPDRLGIHGLPVLADDIPGFPGPLAGILAGMDWARAHVPGCVWLASVPGDAPLLPTDLVARLGEAVAAEGAVMGRAASGDRSHPVVGLWPLALAGELRHALVAEDIRKVTRWTDRYRVAEARWPIQPVDPFFNVNTPEDLAELARLSR